MNGESGISREIREHLDAVQGVVPLLAPTIERVAQLLCSTFDAGGTLYTCGNGGSAADAQHLTGELIGRYRRERRPLRAITLSTDPTVLTCIANDYSVADMFARQVQALVGPSDVLAVFTTSGRSENMVSALRAARARGARTVLFGGGDGGAAREHADYLLLSPATRTPRIQEVHTLMLHLISEIVDDWAEKTEGLS